MTVLSYIRRKNFVVSGNPTDPSFNPPPTVKILWTLYCVCKMRRFGDIAFSNYRDLETRVRGHSRSSKLTPFDSLHMVSYYRPIVTLCLKYTVFEI